MVGTRFYIKTLSGVSNIPFSFESTQSSIKIEPTEGTGTSYDSGVVLHHGKISGYSSLAIPVVFTPNEINDSMIENIEIVFLKPDAEKKLMLLQGSGSLTSLISLSRAIIESNNPEFNQVARMSSILKFEL